MVVKEDGAAVGTLTLLTLEELTERVGMSVRNVRFYTTRGLVPPPIRRGRSGYLKSGRAFCNSVGAWSGSGVGLESGPGGSGCPVRGMPR